MNAPPPGGSLPAGWWRRVRHDLRGAVAPMRMAVQLLRAGKVEAAERDEALGVLERQIEQLLASVDDVGDLMRVQSEGLPQQSSRQDANLLLDVVCGRGLLQRDLAARKLALRCEPCEAEALVSHDPARLSALLEFLVLRAAAHAAPGRELVLGLRDDDGVVIGIRGASPSLARDSELRFLLGVEAGDADPGLRSLVMREVVRTGALQLQVDEEGTLLLRFPSPCVA